MPEMHELAQAQADADADNQAAMKWCEIWTKADTATQQRLMNMVTALETCEGQKELEDFDFVIEQLAENLNPAAVGLAILEREVNKLEDGSQAQEDCTAALAELEEWL